MRPFVNFWGKTNPGKGTTIGSFSDIGDVEIGTNCKIQCHVSIPTGWKIGNNVFIGPKATFCNDKNPRAVGEWKIEGGTVGDNASIGAAAVILSGVNIGNGAVIGAGAVVLKDVEPGVTVVGNPARPIQ